MSPSSQGARVCHYHPLHFRISDSIGPRVKKQIWCSRPGETQQKASRGVILRKSRVEVGKTEEGAVGSHHWGVPMSPCVLTWLFAGREGWRSKCPDVTQHSDWALSLCWSKALWLLNSSGIAEAREPDRRGFSVRLSACSWLRVLSACFAVTTVSAGLGGTAFPCWGACSDGSDVSSLTALPAAWPLGAWWKIDVAIHRKPAGIWLRDHRPRWMSLKHSLNDSVSRGTQPNGRSLFCLPKIAFH